MSSNSENQFNLLRGVINQTEQIDHIGDFNDPLMEMLKFQMRLIMRARDSDFPLLEKLRMANIIFNNITDLLKMKFSKEKFLIVKTGINYIENILFPVLETFIRDTINKLNPYYENPTFINMNNISKEFYIIYPHKDGFRTFIIGDMTKLSEIDIQKMIDNIGSSEIEFIQNKNIQQYITIASTLLDESNTDKRFMLKDPSLRSELLFNDEESLYNEYDYFKELKNHDMIFRVPKDSYNHILDFIHQMCTHEEIESIYITLYRVNENSKIVEELVQAAKLGKTVTVYIEPNARGDEDRNEKICRKLWNMRNMNVIYGIRKFKVHAKMFLAIGPNGAYGHFGTGNYNESTAKRYTDTHILTSSGNIINRALMIFNWFYKSKEYGDELNQVINKFIKTQSTDKLWISPINVKSNINGLILNEIKKGSKGKIFIKCNMLTDKEVIYYLKHAAEVGVQIDIYARSACLFDIPIDNAGCRYSNVNIHSICGRYLEHDRIYMFGDRIFIASADLAFRNMHKRVETFIEIGDSCKDQMKKIIEDIRSTPRKFSKIPSNNISSNQWLYEHY